MYLDEKTYEAAIPPCCVHKTLQEHIEIMLCWGLTSSLEKGYNVDCSGCTQNVNYKENESV